MFKHYPSNDRQIRYQRYGTRLYILLMVISVGIFTQYHLINTIVRRQTILKPSESQYQELEKIYSTDLSCPCTSISISYSTFMTIQAHYHQLCTSYLISSQWFTYSYSGIENGLYILDYRLLANSQFQTLAVFCEQARQLVNDSLSIFLQTQFVSSQVISQQIFKSQMEALIQDWKSSLISQFVRTIELIRATTLANQLMNRLNIYFQGNIAAGNISIEPRLYDNCNCAFSGTCHTSMSIYDFDYSSGDFSEIYSIPNFFVGCYLIDVLLLSTLECFYNQSCMIGLDQYLDSFLRTSFTFPALDATLNLPNETIQSIVDQLMVVSWSSNIDFSSYYDMCAVSSCVAEYKGRNNFFTVITIVIGIYGGLSIGLKMLILLGLRGIEQLIAKFSFKAFIQSIKRFLDCSDEQRMISRLHFILSITIFCVLYIFSAFNSQLIISETKQPSLTVYENLVKQYSDSLQCSCSEISIQYRSFLNITASFHPVCSRDFINELLIATLTGHSSFYQNAPIQYIYAGVGQLQALSSLCQLAQDTVHDFLSQLLSRHLINTELLSSDSLSDRIQTTINDYRVTMSKLFINTFSLTRETTGANKLMTIINSNWMLTPLPNPIEGYTVHTVPVDYQECNCGLSPKCVMNLYGVMVGCYTLEALLQSTFECLYNQECLDRTHTYPALNVSTNPSRFPINSTIESIFNELMIEELFSNFSYTNYFDQCASSSCVYSYIEDSNVIDGITTLVSLYGGLVILCRLIAVIVTKLLRCRLASVNPVTDEQIH